MVVAGGRITAYVSDEANTPIPSARLGGKATVLPEGKREEVPLAPGAGNSLTGKPANPAQGRTTAVLQLTVDGKPVQARVAAP